MEIEGRGIWTISMFGCLYSLHLEYILIFICYLYSSQSAPVKDAMVDVSASGPYRLEDQSAISNSVYLPSENTSKCFF